MARGSSYGEQQPLSPIEVTPQTTIPKRATRILPEVQQYVGEPETYVGDVEYEDDVEQDGYESYDYNIQEDYDAGEHRALVPAQARSGALAYSQDYHSQHYHPLRRHRIWLWPLLLSMACVVVLLSVAVSAGMFQRHDNAQVVPYAGQTFAVQVGGSYNAFNAWESSTGPLPVKTPVSVSVPVKHGSYSVLGAPTISAAFINRVLAYYHSPAAGLGQQMYDLGVKYGIDPVYALAFFQHESSFGTTGEATVTLSLGNLRCIPTRPCIDQNRGGYAQMSSWTDGFDQWYKLIRNLYVAQWGLITVDQIIPTYAPNSDHNNEAEYIAALKHSVDTWRAGGLTT